MSYDEQRISDLIDGGLKKKWELQNTSWAVTGTFHGSIVYARSEGDARRLFHKHYNGESIIHIKLRHEY